MNQLPSACWPSNSGVFHQYDGLPPEIQTQIISYVQRPGDLEALCLTSKLVRKIATPFLYRTVSLKLGGPRDSHIIGLASSFNPGIQYIKNLDLGVVEACSTLADHRTGGWEDGNQGIDDVEGSIKQAHLMVRMLLEALPRNKLKNNLRTFTWNSWKPFSLENWVLLCKNQIQLTCVEIGPLDRPYTSILTQLPTLLGAFSNISTLSLFATSFDVLQAFQKALQAHPKIKALNLISKWTSTEESLADLQDTSTRPGLIFRTIFSHLMPFSECTPIETKKISIENIELRYADRFLMKAVAFNSLDFLSIGACVAPEGLFAQLSQTQQLPSHLRSLRWFHQDAIEPHVLNALERLLEQLPVLERIHIELDDAHRLPESKAISHSGASLRSLLVRVHDSESTLLEYKIEEVSQICAACTGLRELSVALPQMDLSKNRPLSRWEAYLDSTRKLPNLVTLNIQNWPETMVSLHDPQSESMRIYENQLQRLAQLIFNASDVKAKNSGWGLGHRSRLAVLAFGANSTSSYGEPNDDIKLEQIVFTRGAVTDALGRTVMLPVKTFWKHIELIEPGSEILIYSSDHVAGVQDRP